MISERKKTVRPIVAYIHLDNANLRNRIIFHVKWMGLAPIIRTYLEKDRKMLMVYSLTGYVYRNRFQKYQYINASLGSFSLLNFFFNILT